jgi:hypothetical protein
MDYVLAILVLGVLCTVASSGFIYSGAKNASMKKIGELQIIEYVIPIL